MVITVRLTGFVLYVGLLCTASARSSGSSLKNPAKQRKFFCSPISNIAPFCAGASPQKVCTENGRAVDGSVLTKAAYDTTKDGPPPACPKDVQLFTKSVFCKGGIRPWLPCKQASDCDIPASLKQCYGLCLSGGKTPKQTILGAQQCQTGEPQGFCNGLLAAGRVAAPGNAACLGITDYIEQEAREQYGTTVFRARQCTGTFPISNHEFSALDLEGRKQFALEVTLKINQMLGYCRLNDAGTTWVNRHGDQDCLEDEFVYRRPRDIRANRVQLLHGYPTVFIRIKQFCKIPLREGPAMYVNGEPENQYCDAPSQDPEKIFANFTKILEDNMGPDESGPFTVGPYPRLKWDKKFEILKGGKPLWPQHCGYEEPKRDENPPPWVWGLVALSSMLLLLSVLILQHRYRNRVSYARQKASSSFE